MQAPHARQYVSMVCVFADCACCACAAWLRRERAPPATTPTAAPVFAPLLALPLATSPTTAPRARSPCGPVVATGAAATAAGSMPVSVLAHVWHAASSCDFCSADWPLAGYALGCCAEALPTTRMRARQASRC